MNLPTVSVDLGASYTKIGFRPECAPRIRAPFEREAEVLVIQGGPLIPSLVVQTRRTKQPWLFGHEAAEYRPAPGSIIHTNWKSGLYRPTNDGDAAQAAVIAEKFFRWLKRELTPFVGDWELHRLRLTLPAFANGKNLEDVIRKCLSLADWSAGEIVITTEPHANAIGLMTVGRNVVTRGKDGVFIDFGQMFGHGNPYIRAARAATLGGSAQRALRVAVIDIGAFTTDLAVLDFDVTTIETSDDGLASIEQESFAVGTYDQLDECFWKALQAAHGSFVEQLTFAEREELKQRIFNGDKYSLTIAGTRRKFGSPQDQEIAAASADRFATLVWNAVRPKFELSNPDVVYLTGGGSGIGPVAIRLSQTIKKIATQPAIALQATSSSAGWTKWRQAGMGLDRLATAIGGVSVIVPSPLNRAIVGVKTSARSGPSPTAPQRGPRACTCHGNPDCPRCGGTGYVEIE